MSQTFYFFAARAQEINIEKRFWRALTIISPKFGESGHFSFFVTMARFEPTTLRFMSQAFYYFAAGA